MAKDTKDIVIQSLLALALEDKKLTIEKISKHSGVTRLAIQKNFNNKGIKGIVEYIHAKVSLEINALLMKHDPNDIPIGIFADIFLSTIWKYRVENKILYEAGLIPDSAKLSTKFSLAWAEKRFTFLVTEHNLSSVVSTESLLIFWNSYLNSIIVLWLSQEKPLEPKDFKPFFLYLMETSMLELIYKDIHPKP